MIVSVITVSDRAHAGIYEDLSGPEIENIVKKSFPFAEVKRSIIPDEEKMLEKALEENLNSDFILTTGGTGISERDRTPEVSKRFCDFDLPGMSAILLTESYRQTPNAMLSRIYAGVKNKTIVVNFPGSVNAVRLCAQIMVSVMEHALKMLRGEKH